MNSAAIRCICHEPADLLLVTPGHSDIHGRRAPRSRLRICPVIAKQLVSIECRTFDQARPIPDRKVRDGVVTEPGLRWNEAISFVAASAVMIALRRLPSPVKDDPVYVRQYR